MGILYLALDPAIDRLVAVKVLRTHNDELHDRFMREARSAGRLRHPNIVTIYDIGDHDGQPFLAMEYIDGETLNEIIRRRAPFTVARKLQVVEDLCSGLHYAHKAGIVHRDVKPANLIIDRDGTLKILDFGIARTMDSGTTQTGVMMGTPSYMSPEQIRGEHVDHRADVFAVGLVLYEILTYRQAFPGEQMFEAIRRVQFEEPTPLDVLIPDVDRDLVHIVERAIAKSADDRYQDLAALQAELSSIRAGTAMSGDAEATVVNRSSPTTPRPTPRPTPGSDREDYMRRRTSQISAYLNVAESALQADDLDRASASADAAAMLDPDNHRTLQMLGRIRDARDARAATSLVREAEMQLEAGALTIAEGLASRALELRPTPEAERFRARVADERAQRNAKRRFIEQSLADAQMRLENGSFESAIRILDDVLMRAPDLETAILLRRDAEVGLVERERLSALAVRAKAEADAEAAARAEEAHRRETAVRAETAARAEDARRREAAIRAEAAAEAEDARRREAAVRAEADARAAAAARETAARGDLAADRDEAPRSGEAAVATWHRGDAEPQLGQLEGTDEDEPSPGDLSEGEIPPPAPSAQWARRMPPWLLAGTGLAATAAGAWLVMGLRGDPNQGQAPAPFVVTEPQPTGPPTPTTTPPPDTLNDDADARVAALLDETRSLLDAGALQQAAAKAAAAKAIKSDDGVVNQMLAAIFDRVARQAANAKASASRVKGAAQLASFRAAEQAERDGQRSATTAPERAVSQLAEAERQYRQAEAEGTASLMAAADQQSLRTWAAEQLAAARAYETRQQWSDALQIYNTIKGRVPATPGLDGFIANADRNRTALQSPPPPPPTQPQSAPADTATVRADPQATPGPVATVTTLPVQAPAAGDVTASVNGEAAARGVIDRFAAAYGRKDLGELQRLYPTIDGRTYERTFADNRSLAWTVQGCDIKGDAAQLVASCAILAERVDNFGRKGAQTTRRDMMLTRAGDGWIITGMTLR